MKQFNQQTLSKVVGSQKTKKELTNYLDSTETLPHVINGQQIQLPIPVWINEKFNEAYPSWSKKELPSTWIQGISVLSVMQIRRAVNYFLTEKEITDLKTDFPPSLRQFIAAGQDNGIDADESFDRFINREPLSDIEYFTSQDVGDRCRTRLAEDKARALWKKTLSKYAKRKEEGTLPDRNQKAISHTSKKAGKTWEGPDGEFYSCPADYWRKQLDSK